MTSAVFLSIRAKSTRLPRKALRQIRGKTTTEHLIDRLKLARRPDAIVVTTSVHPDDVTLCGIAGRCGVSHFRGSEEDKLRRYLDAANALGVDFAVIVDGDDLFCSEEHIDETIDAFDRTGADYITQIGLPFGAASFGVKRSALARVCELKAERDTEVWGAYFTGTGLFNVHMIPISDPAVRLPGARMTLDYEEDLRFFTAVIEGTYRDDAPVPSFRDIIHFLASRPDIVALNQGVVAKYEAHLRKSAPARLRPGV